jgi:hypothetical protein
MVWIIAVNVVSGKQTLRDLVTLERADRVIR